MNILINIMAVVSLVIAPLVYQPLHRPEIQNVSSVFAAHSMPEYNNAAQRYRPNKIKVLFIAESPPAFESRDKKSYFYFEDNPGSDILFATLIKALFDVEYKKADANKPELLTKLKDSRFWLIDAIETPINKINGNKTTEKERAVLIKDAVPALLSRLEALRLKGFINKNTGIILIKKVVFTVLSPILSDHGFQVLHQRKIDFPKYYRDRDTIREIQIALQRMNLDSDKTVK